MSRTVVPILSNRVGYQKTFRVQAVDRTDGSYLVKDEHKSSLGYVDLPLPSEPNYLFITDTLCNLAEKGIILGLAGCYVRCEQRLVVGGLYEGVLTNASFGEDIHLLTFQMEREVLDPYYAIRSKSGFYLSENFAQPGQDESSWITDPKLCTRYTELKGALNSLIRLCIETARSGCRYGVFSIVRVTHEDDSTDCGMEQILELEVSKVVA